MKTLNICADTSSSKKSRQAASRFLQNPRKHVVRLRAKLHWMGQC
jgi:hypothetical protein